MFAVKVSRSLKAQSWFTEGLSWTLKQLMPEDREPFTMIQNKQVIKPPKRQISNTTYTFLKQVLKVPRFHNQRWILNWSHQGKQFFRWFNAALKWTESGPTQTLHDGSRRKISGWHDLSIQVKEGNKTKLHSINICKEGDRIHSIATNCSCNFLTWSDV